MNLMAFIGLNVKFYKKHILNYTMWMLING